MNNFIVYLLINTRNKYTYLGVTNNSIKRIRQHNGEIKGGAKYTRAKKKNGIWKYYMKISNLTKSEAYSMESLIKYATKKIYKNNKTKTSFERKVNLILEFQEKYPHSKIHFFFK